MRYTRNRQLIKLGRDHKEQKNYSVQHMKDEFLGGEIDPSFKWHRDLGTIQFDTKCRVLKDKEVWVTKVMPLKFDEGMPKWASIYSHGLED